MGERGWLMGALAAGATAVAGHFHDAPRVMFIAAAALMPMLIIDALTAIWAQAVARRVRTGEVEIPPSDTWVRATVRIGMVLCLVIIAAVSDLLVGTPHMTTTWVLMWGVMGHMQATLRRLRLIADAYHLPQPIFPPEAEARLRVPDDPAPMPGREGDDA